MRATRLLYVQYANPGAYPPLEHGARILAQTGAEILVLGTGAAFGAGALKWAPQPGIHVSQLVYCPPGWKQKFHYILFAGWVFCRALVFRPTIIYGSDWLVCPTLLLLSLFWNVVYHEHDIPLAAFREQSRGSSKEEIITPFIRFVLWSRERIANTAILCIAPNDGRAGALRKTTQTVRPILSVWNCPSRDEVLVGGRRPAESGSITLFYHGSIVPERLPLTVLMAVAELSGQVRLRIAGYETIGYSGYCDLLRSYSAELGITDYVTFLGPIPRRGDLLKQCCLADVGLAILPSESQDFNQQTMAGASNKPFDYMACGLALLVGDLADWRELYVSNGYGVACDAFRASSIATSLRWFLSNPGEMTAMGRRGQEKILRDWNYETQFAEVRDRLLDSSQTQAEGAFVES